jgi:hypothetical protein
MYNVYRATYVSRIIQFIWECWSERQQTCCWSWQCLEKKQMVRVCKFQTKYTNLLHKRLCFFGRQYSRVQARNSLSFVKPKFITLFGRTRHLHLSTQVFKINLVCIFLLPIRANCHAYAILVFIVVIQRHTLCNNIDNQLDATITVY